MTKKEGGGGRERASLSLVRVGGRPALDGIVSRRSCPNLLVNTPPHIFPALRSPPTDEFHEYPFQEPLRFETKKRCWKSIALSSRHHHPHRHCWPQLAVASGLKLEQHVAAHESPKPPGPPALVHFCSAGRSRHPEPGPWSSLEPSAAAQHWRTGLSSPAAAAAAHGLSTTARPAWLSSTAAGRSVWRAAVWRPASTRPWCPAWCARTNIQTTRHGRSRRRRPLQGPADCWN